MKKLLISVLILAFVLVGTQVEAVDGYGEIAYCTMTGSGSGLLVIYEDFFNDKLRIGLEMESRLMGFGFKDGYMPSGIPESQSYYLFVEYGVTNAITVFMRQGCVHYFSQAENKDWTDDIENIVVGGRYDF